MEISGTYEFTAPAQRVWETLMDPQVLAGCLPGCDRLESTGEDEYQAQVNVGIGPVRGSYHAKLALRDQQPPQSFRLVMEGSGPAGFANGEALVTLAEQDGKTSVQVTGAGEVGGRVALVGQRLMGSVAKSMLDRFFGCLGEAAQ